MKKCKHKWKYKVNYKSGSFRFYATFTEGRCKKCGIRQSFSEVREPVGFVDAIE